MHFIWFIYIENLIDKYLIFETALFPCGARWNTAEVILVFFFSIRSCSGTFWIVVCVHVLRFAELGFAVTRCFKYRLNKSWTQNYYNTFLVIIPFTFQYVSFHNDQQFFFVCLTTTFEHNETDLDEILCGFQEKTYFNYSHRLLFK